MQLTATEQITVLLTRARTREKVVLGQIAQALDGDKHYLAALQKRLQERQARIMLLESELREARQ